jgi:MoxR-like ATPase
MQGRAYVRPSDVKEIFADAARHRIMRSLRAEAERVDADVVLDELLRGVAVS